jgi:DNA-binding transcriptional ArsR family regulator
MNARPIPAHPVALTAEEATLMEQRTIKKHDVAIILLHWFNASVWLIELISGLALIVASAYRVMPLWYTTMIASALGSRANVLRLHVAMGLTWIVVFLVYGIFGYRNYLRKEVLVNEVGLDWDDMKWLRIRILLLLNRTQKSLPEQGSYNAGQKLFALLVYAAQLRRMGRRSIDLFALGEEQALPKSKAEPITPRPKTKGKRASNTDRLIYQRQSQICKAFANPVRIQILEMLGQRERYVSELLEELGISKPNLSQHLAILRNSGVVTTSRVGKQLSCTLAMPEVKNACELIRNVLRKQVDEGRKLIV